MLAKTFTIFTLQPDKTAAFASALNHDNLATRALQPRHKTQAATMGFVPAVPLAMGGGGVGGEGEGGPLIHCVDGGLVFRVGIEKAVVKKGAITADTSRAVAQLTRQTGQPPTRGGIYEIKERVTAEHLATAKSEFFYYYGWLDTASNRLIMGAASGVGEDMGQLMRQAMHDPLGGLFISRLATQHSPTDILTAMAQNGGYSDNRQAAIGDALKFKASPGQEISIKGEHDPQLLALILGNDYKLGRAQILVNNRAYLTLDENWNISGAILHPDQQAALDDDAGADDPESKLSEWQARAFLTAAELRVALDALIEVHGGLASVGEVTP